MSCLSQQGYPLPQPTATIHIWVTLDPRELITFGSLSLVGLAIFTWAK